MPRDLRLALHAKSVGRRVTLERPGPVVEVEWVDSTGQDGWHEPDHARELPEKMACRSVGYLVADTDEGIVITQGAGGVGQWLNSMAIPRAAIVSIGPEGYKK